MDNGDAASRHSTGGTVDEVEEYFRHQRTQKTRDVVHDDIAGCQFRVPGHQLADGRLHVVVRHLAEPRQYVT